MRLALIIKIAVPKHEQVFEYLTNLVWNKQFSILMSQNGVRKPFSIRCRIYYDIQMEMIMLNRVAGSHAADDVTVTGNWRKGKYHCNMEVTLAESGIL